MTARDAEESTPASGDVAPIEMDGWPDTPTGTAALVRASALYYDKRSGT